MFLQPRVPRLPWASELLRRDESGGLWMVRERATPSIVLLIQTTCSGPAALLRILLV